MSREMFRKNLKYLIQHNNLTVVEFSEAIRVKGATVRSWMEGRAYPRIPQLLETMEVLNYHDFQALLTVDIQKHKKPRQQALPPNVARLLRNIQELAKEGLSEEKPFTKNKHRSEKQKQQ